jgi:DnaJ-class molecular chaperone
LIDGYWEISPCDQCDGTGVTDPTPCQHCDSRGWIIDDPLNYDPDGVIFE